MTYPRTVTARLLDTDGSTVVSGTPLANAFNITFKDELNGPGVGALALSISEAGAAQLTPGRFVDILIEGTSRFTFEIEGDPEYSIHGEGEEYDAIVQVQGRGWACHLDKAIIEPEVALDLKLDAPWRVFSFASPSFPNGGAWGAADELYEYQDALTALHSGGQPVNRFQRVITPTSDGVYPSPISFPVPTSPNFYDPDSPPGASYVPVYWIAVTGQDLAIGYSFFRKSFTITTPDIYVLAVTADNYFTLFLEGVPVLGEQTDHFIWQGWKEETVFLPAGTYQLGAVVENVDTGLVYNPTGFIMTVHRVDSASQLPNAVSVVTDNTWTAFHVADDGYWPGWTPGQIVEKILTEALARTGGLGAFNSDSFTAFTHTGGGAWSDSQAASQYVPAFSVEVGSTIMAALTKLHEQGQVDWHMRPGTMILDMWAWGALGTTPGVSLVAGTNLATYQRGATSVYANALLVQWEGGYVRVEDTAAITALGQRIEDLYSSEANSADEATRQGLVELEQRARDGWPAILVTVEPVSTADCPYEGFTLGDTVTIPALGGGTENIRVLSISCEQDELGYAIWRLELNQRWRSLVRESNDLLREIGGRSGYSDGRVR